MDRYRKTLEIGKRQVVMDNTGLKILDPLEGNARMQESGNAIGMSRVGTKKRVQKLDPEGIIRGCYTCIYRENTITMFIDIVTAQEKVNSLQIVDSAPCATLFSTKGRKQLE